MTSQETPDSRGTPATQPNTDSIFTVDLLDPDNFSAHRIAPIRHNFDNHPLMKLEALRQLAHNLYAIDKCRFVPATTTKSSAFTTAGKSLDGRDIDEIFDTMEVSGSWIALYNIENDPLYQGFLAEAMENVRSQVEKHQPGIYDVQGFLFISAPPAVTPFHIDRENNFWLQIRGRKTITLWDHRDREVVSQLGVEQFLVERNLHHVHYNEAHEARGTDYDMGPGNGIYFPSTTPHMTRSGTDWCRPGDGISISVGVVFYTENTRRNSHIHAINSVLRRLGHRPKHPGSSPFDGLKAVLGSTMISLNKKIRGHAPPPGF